MTRFASLLLSCALLTLIACGESHDGADAGHDAGIVVTIDAGRDAGPPSADGGTPRLDSATPVPDAAPPDRDGSLLPPIDGGNPFGDAGALGEPAWADVDVHYDGTECDALVPCGGDVVGTWDVTGGCFELPNIETMIALCPGATITTRTARARGRVSFDGTFARRLAQSEVEIEVFVPAICASFAGGCDGIETQVQMRVPDSACVASAAGDCTCAARQIGVIDDADAYTIEGNEIVSSTGAKRWAYCISGTAGSRSLSYEDVSPSGTREPGIIELGER
jgi:hypothetical protein